MAQIVTLKNLASNTNDELRKFEKINTLIHKNSESASLFVAKEIASLIRERQKQGKMAVLGLATGSTPTKVYDFLVQFHQKDGYGTRFYSQLCSVYE